MARRDTAKLALASDPASNRWFSRAWVLPPPLGRKSPGAPTPGQIFESHNNSVNDTAPLTKAQARALAERLFGLEAGANRTERRRATALEWMGGPYDRRP